MKNRYYIIILFLCCLYSSESHWSTTRFETFWKKNFTQMNFRNPIIFFPYDIKIGYLKYGGKDYYKQFSNLFASKDDLDNNAFDTSNSNFPNLSNTKDRTLISLQLDLFRYNFFRSINNKFDITTGFGFKVIKGLENVLFENGDILNPEFHEININNTVIIQNRPNFYNYLYYTIGYNNASFYKTAIDNIESTGSGISHSFGLGFDFIIPNSNKSNNVHCGLELNFGKISFDKDKIKEPYNLDYINSIDIETVGLVLSFGIGYGGRKTIGDDAYLSMLNRDYIQASEQFYRYKNDNDIIYNADDLSEMMLFCEGQIPYQLYSISLDQYYDNNLNDAAETISKIKFNDSKDLNYKVESLKYKISDKMLSDFINYKDEYSITYQIQYLKSIKKISSQIRSSVDKYLFNIYLDKGDLLLSNNSYEEAYKYYMHAHSINDDGLQRIEIKIKNLIIYVLNDVYKLLQNKENVLAYEKLSFAKDISSKNNNVNFLRTFIKDKISSEKKDGIKNRMIDIIDNKRKFVETVAKKNIYLGDTYDVVINTLGKPLNKISRDQYDNSYEMLTYLFNELEYRLFFKNKILIDMERDK